VKESVPSAMNIKAARMISKSNSLIKGAMMWELLLKMEGQQKTALAAVLVNKSRLPRKKNSKRKSQECQKTHDRQRRLRSFSCKVYKATPFYISMKKVL
jgi:hypothetical protein